MADGGFGWSEGIAALSLGVSIVALTWANVSAKAAQRANNIQLHVYQRALFVAFHDLHIKFQGKGHYIDIDDIHAFSEHAKTAFLYVNDNLAKSIYEFYNQCLQIHILHESIEHSSLSLAQLREDHCEIEQLNYAESNLKQLRNEMNAVLRQAIKYGWPTFEALKNEIKIDKSHTTIWQRFKELYNKPFSWGDEEELG